MDEAEDASFVRPPEVPKTPPSGAAREEEARIEQMLEAVREEEARAASALADAKNRRLALIDELRGARQSKPPEDILNRTAFVERAQQEQAQQQQPNLDSTAWRDAMGSSPERRDAAPLQLSLIHI